MFCPISLDTKIKQDGILLFHSAPQKLSFKPAKRYDFFILPEMFQMQTTMQKQHSSAVLLVTTLSMPGYWTDCA